jgi:hypothetical protein
VLLNGNSTALAAPPPQVPVVVTQIPRDEAMGLFVPGAGATVSRKGALAALVRGKVENAVLGGTPGGRPEIQVTFVRRGMPLPYLPVAIYVELPPPGRHPNTRRYPIVVAGAGYRGILTSSTTRIRGLVSITDVAQTARALAQGRKPAIRWEPDRDTQEDLAALDRRLADAHGARSGALAVLAGLVAALTAASALARRELLGRAAILGGAAGIAVSLLLSGTRPLVALVGLGLVGLAFALVGAALRLPLTLVLFFLALLLVLSVHTELFSFASLGPRPENGGRFYGITNLVETVLLPPVLAAAATGWLVVVGLLALVTLGWSHAGADGGGLIVYLVALAVLWLRLRGLALTPRRLVAIAAGVVAVGLALVGIDAALGGSSHVTHAVGGGPGSLASHFGHRLHLSWAALTSSWHKGINFLLSIAGLVVLATRRPRAATIDAFLIAIVVSLVVNDTPGDVAAAGAIGGLALLSWERARAR